MAERVEGNPYDGDAIEYNIEHGQGPARTGPGFTDHGRQIKEEFERRTAKRRDPEPRRLPPELEERQSIIEGIAQRRREELIKDIEAGERSKEALVDSLYEMEEQEREAEERRQEELDENLITSRDDLLERLAEDEEIGERIMDRPELLDMAWLEADELISQGHRHNDYRTYRKAIQYVLDKDDAVERDYTDQLRNQASFWNDDLRKVIAMKRREELSEDAEKWKEASKKAADPQKPTLEEMGELAQTYHPIATHPIVTDHAQRIYQDKIAKGDERPPWQVMDESLDIAKRQASIHDMAIMRGQQGAGIGKVVPGPGHMGQSERPQETQRQPSKRGRTKK